MSECTVQVPVSLIERTWRYAAECGQWQDSSELRALIQPATRESHADDCCYLEEDVVEPYGTRLSPHAHCTCDAVPPIEPTEHAA